MKLVHVNRRGFLGTLAGVGGFLSGCSRNDSRPITVSRKPSDDTPPAKGAPPSSLPTGEKEFAYAIDLQKDGGTHRVHENFLFHSGDGFRLLLKPGFSAYLYLFNYGSREQGYRLLFPSSTAHVSNPIPSGGQAQIPDAATIWMRFDQNPGEEHFVIVVSTIALRELEPGLDLIPRDRLDGILANVERQYAPKSSRRFEDGDWVKIFAADSGGKDIAMVVRLPLKHT